MCEAVENLHFFLFYQLRLSKTDFKLSSFLTVDEFKNK